MAIMTEVPEKTTLTFSQALERIEVEARQALPPAAHERLSAAVGLVKNGAVFQTDAGHWEVQSTSEPGTLYTVNGTCACPDSQYRHAHCKHMSAWKLYQHVAKQLDPPPAPAPEPAPEVPTEPVQGIDPRYITHLHGKPFVRYAGLLAMAHERGLVSLKAHFISVTGELALAEAEAVFADGRTYSECADSTPGNVPQHIRPHFPRMALTRSKARALRDALNLGAITAYEELAGEVE